MEGVTRLQVGSHEIAFRPPATVQISFCGDVTLPEAERIADFSALHVFELARPLFLIELHRLGKVPPDARRALTGRLPRDERVGARCFRIAFAGANLRTRVLMSRALSTTEITQRDELMSRFFPSVDEALAWARATAALR